MTRITWEENNPAEERFTIGLNLTVFGLMAGTIVSEDVLEGEALMAPERSSEKDLKLEQVGFEGTGLAITIRSASLTSISSQYMMSLLRAFVA